MMKKEWNKITFYKERSFGERLGASFSFIGENVRSISKYSLAFLLPIVVLYAVSFTLFINVSLLPYVDRHYIKPTDIGIVFCFFLFSLMFTIVLPSFFYALLQVYNKREDRLKGAVFNELLKVVKGNFTRVTVIILIYFFLAHFFIVELKSYPYTLMASFAVILLTIMVPFVFWIPAYCIERRSLLKSFVNAFKANYRSWGSSLGMWIVLGLIRIAVSLLFAFPLIVFIIVDLQYFVSDHAGSLSFLYLFLSFICSLLFFIGYVIASLPYYIGMAYQYAHLSTPKAEKRIIVDDLDKAEQSFDVLRKD